MSTTHQQHRRRFQFGLRTTLIVVAVIAAPTAWVAKEQRQAQREAEIGNTLRALKFLQVDFAGPFAKHYGENDLESYFRVALRKLLGERLVNAVGPLDPVQNLTLLGELSNLRHLVVIVAPDADLLPLLNLKKLDKLYLQSSAKTDLTIVAECRSLTRLDLVATPIGDVTPLAKLKNLRSLCLINTEVSDVAPISTLEKLEVLDLGGTQSTDLEPLVALKNLQELGLRNTPVVDLSPISKLTNLESLDLDGSQVRDLSPLARLTKLARVSLNGTQVTDEEVRALQKALPNCEIDD